MKLLVAVVVSLLAGLALGGCAADDDDAANSSADNDSVDDDSNGDETIPPDAVSSTYSWRVHGASPAAGSPWF